MTGGYEEPETRREIAPVSAGESAHADASRDAEVSDNAATAGAAGRSDSAGTSANTASSGSAATSGSSAPGSASGNSSANGDSGASGDGASRGSSVTGDGALDGDSAGPVLQGTYMHAAPDYGTPDYGTGSTTSSQNTSSQNTSSPSQASPFQSSSPSSSQSSPPHPSRSSGEYIEPETSPGTYPSIEHPPPSYVDPSASNVVGPPQYPAAPPHAGSVPPAPPYGDPSAPAPLPFPYGQGPYGDVSHYAEGAPSGPQPSGPQPGVGTPSGPYPPQHGAPAGPHAVAGDPSEASQQAPSQQAPSQQAPSQQQVQGQLFAGQPGQPVQPPRSGQPQPGQPPQPGQSAQQAQPTPPAAPQRQQQHPFPQPQGNAAEQPFGSDLSSAQLLRQGKRPPQSGWRRAVYLASGRSINLGESSADVHRRELISRINQPLHGCYKIAMLSLKGGVGKTTTTATLGSTFSSLRGDRVIAVDANPDRGTLSQKIPLETTATVRHLLRDSQMVRKYSDVRSYTSQGPSRLEILASEQDPAVSEAFSEDDYRRTVTMLEHFYNVVLTDCGTGLMHSAMKGVLDIADSLVIISSSSIDGARSASATLDWLDAHGYGQLVARSVSVINSVRPGSGKVDVDKLAGHFESRCRAVAKIPFDQHLEEGAEIELDQLEDSTRLALLELAAVVADDFPQAPGRQR